MRHTLFILFLFSAAERAALSDAALVAAVKDKAYFSGAYVLTPSHACFGINTPQGTRTVFFDESAQKVIVGPRMPLTALGPWFIEVCWPPKGTAPVLHGYKLRTNRPFPNPSRSQSGLLPRVSGPFPQQGRGGEAGERLGKDGGSQKGTGRGVNTLPCWGKGSLSERGGGIYS